jgi:hypothetical protein
MMSDSKRLLSTTGEQHEIERSLLRSLRDVTAPPDAKAETWTRLQAELAAAATAAIAVGGAVAAESVGRAVVGSSMEAGVAATPTGLATSAAIGATAIKLGLGLLVVGSITVGAVALWPRGTPTITSRSSTTIVPAPSVPPSAAAVLATEDPAAIPAVPSNSMATHTKRPAPPAIPDPLSVEAAMVTKARAQLRGGDARAALSTLGRLQSRSRNGALGQERELLTIQALSALGETDAARRRARAFVASYPDSPHAAQVRGIAHGP